MDPDVNYLQFTLISIALIALCGFFSLSEGALITANDAKIKKLASEGNSKAKKIIKITSKPTEFLATSEMGITLCGLFWIALASRIYPVMARPLSELTNMSYGLSYGIIFAVATIIAAFVVIVFGKLIPKRLSEYSTEALALKVIPVYNVISIILNPVAKVLSKLTDLILLMFGLKPDEKAEHVTEEEIRMMVDVGGEKGVIEESEKYMINSIFEMDDREISEIMTHRMDVVAVEKNTTFDEILNLATETGYSRMPVYEEDIDNIIGIVYIKDLIKSRNNSNDFVLADNLREALYVPESVTFTELLTAFKKEKKQFAVVVDEYGGTYGIITMEDVLESIVGDIQDEYDNEDEEFEKASDGTVTFDGTISLDDAERELDVELTSPDDDDYDTLGAMLIHALGHIPEPGENPVVIISGVSFKVLEVDGTRIVKAKAEVLPKEENDEDEEDYQNED